jgi:hypothetical protein
MGTAPSTVVFLGPSLNSKEAAKHLEARYLPPIRRGDLPRVINAGAQAIGIVDGEFGQSLAVSVMEICAGLKQGIQIWGAASMGALRAVECQSMGMLGVGWIFQKYAAGFLRADDEVALLIDPRDYSATTIPLVNMRWAIQLAIAEGLLPESSEVALLKLARAVRYTSRTYEGMMEAASHSPFHTEMKTLLEFMKKNPEGSDRKRLDALLLLEAMHKNNLRAG